MNKTIAFEIGTEELPALELHNATKQVEDLVCNQPGKIFDYEDIQIFSTPRRIILQISGVPQTIEAKTEEYKGPKEEIAFIDGKPSKAAIGFAKGKGLSADDLVVKDGYVFATKSFPEQKVIDLLPDLLLSIIKNIKWKKVQRWGDRDEEFARPIRWIFAMFGSEIINFEYADIKSSNVSYAHRFLSPGPHKISDANKLVDFLKDNYVVLKESEREQIIRKQIKDIENKTKLTAELPVSIMQEVVNLCEYPTCMVGQFDKLFLDVPKEIIVDAMLVHQRYFPLFDNNKLTNKFIIVSNGDSKYEDTIVDGNQRVVAARLYDAKFFVDEDKKHPLEYYVSKLDSVVFQESLGNMFDKANRISNLSYEIANNAKLSKEEQELAQRAGLLAKADLVSSAVIEFTQVQGIMGYYYAISSNEKDDVALAIKEQYMPKFAGDNLPSTKVSKAVAIADKLDTLCGMFAIGQAPTGSSDPFALRRGAIGIINIMRDNFIFKLSDAIKYSLNQYQKAGIKFDENKVYKDIVDFIITRTRVLLKDSGIDHQSIEAVCAIDIEEPLDLIDRACALDNARKSNWQLFEDLSTAFARANNLRDKDLSIEINTNIFNNDEFKLYNAVNNAKNNINKLLANNDYPLILDELAKLRSPIDSFFENVMIMDKDKNIKNNRMALLNIFVDVFSGIADFSKMAKIK